MVDFVAKAHKVCEHSHCTITGVDSEHFELYIKYLLFYFILHYNSYRDAYIPCLYIFLVVEPTTTTTTQYIVVVVVVMPSNYVKANNLSI